MDYLAKPASEHHCPLFLLRSYRDHYNSGYISYGKSLGAGVVITVYAAIITAIYIYVLYAFIDPGLIDKSLALAEAVG